VVPIWRELREAFAIRLEVEEMAAEGARVAARYVERGRSVGPFRGQGPTGKSYEIAAMEWFVIVGGRIWKRWGARDSAAQFRQMGLSIT
jgi:predicted ester cyclase